MIAIGERLGGNRNPEQHGLDQSHPSAWRELSRERSTWPVAEKGKLSRHGVGCAKASGEKTAHFINRVLLSALGVTGVRVAHCNSLSLLL